MNRKADFLQNESIRIMDRIESIGIVSCDAQVVICLQQDADSFIWSSLCHCIPKPHLLPHLNPDWFYLSGTGLHTLFWKKEAIKRV